jgi:hypothetical protein
MVFSHILVPSYLVNGKCKGKAVSIRTYTDPLGIQEFEASRIFRQ